MSAAFLGVGLIPEERKLEGWEAGSGGSAVRFL